MTKWNPIETMPFGRHIMIYFAEGEKGNGGVECATVFDNEDGTWSYWTHGGPNSGFDWDAPEKPILWSEIEYPSDAIGGGVMGEHEWFNFGTILGSDIPCCKWCGMVRRKDGGNKPCVGKVKIQTRGIKNLEDRITDITKEQP